MAVTTEMKVIDLHEYALSRKKEEDVSIDGSDILEYVYSRISFPLSRDTYAAIDDLFADMWNHMQPGDFIEEMGITGSIHEALKNRGMLLSRSRTSEIVSLMLDFLTEEGHADVFS
jgi:hypothetical protein